MQWIASANWDFDQVPVVDRSPMLGNFGRLPSQITPQVFLSDYWTAKDVRKIEDLGITHIISLLDFVPRLPERILADRKLHIDLDDHPKANILQHLEATTAFIAAATAEKGNKVLVHCMMGVSRSPTVVCAYLVATTNMTAAESIKHVQSIRRVVCPNHGFRQQLEEYGTHFVKTKTTIFPEIFKLSNITALLRELRNSIDGKDESPKPHT